MDRILDAFDGLIQKRPYDDITLADIAKRAGTGSSSIYARFKDKRAILLAVHQRVRERAVTRFEDICRPDRWTKVEIEQALTGIVASMLIWYRENHHVMKAALLLNDQIMYENIANSVHAGSIQLSYFIQDRVSGQTRLRAVRIADFVFRIMTATFQQIAIFDPISPTKDTLNDKQLIRGIVVAALAQLQSGPNDGILYLHNSRPRLA